MILKKVKKAIKLYDPRNLYSLSIRVMRLENKLNTMINNPNRLWLEINKDERMDIKRSSNIIALTGEKQIVINKKNAKKGTTFAIQAVSRNNNMSNAVSIKK